MIRRQSISLLLAAGVAAAALPAAARAGAPAKKSSPTRSRSSRGGGNRASDIHGTGKRLGTLRQGSNSASTIGAVSFLLGGPIGWGIYRGVDHLTRRR